jgi:hypothetical protein
MTSLVGAYCWPSITPCCTLGFAPATVLPAEVFAEESYRRDMQLSGSHDERARQLLGKSKFIFFLLCLLGLR